jgi:D-alanyl-D-alanine carboxypeptidase
MLCALALALTLATGAAAIGCGDTAGAGGIAPVAASPAALDSALQEGVRASGAPGATGAVVVDGQLLWTGATGHARLGGDGAMRPDSLFPIASTTKTVTATMAMTLAEDGALDLDRPIAWALPWVVGARRITPRQLMSHSSGLRDYFSDGAIAWIASRHPYHRWTRREVLRHADGLQFPPGSRHSYSNSGYVALGGVIEAASGERVDTLFQQRIAEPLGLQGSTYRYGNAPQRLFAHPLRPAGGGRLYDRFGRRARVPTDYWGETWTDGGLATTSAGLAQIGNGVYAGDLLSPASVAQMLPDKPGGWGLGTFDKRALGRTWIGHDGSYGGYQTENWTDRASGVTVVVMTNGAGMGVLSPRIWRAVAAAAVETRR